jgi:AAA family ATP:ADP antiporter
VTERTQGGLLNRFLRLFADVRPGEGGIALLLALNVFLLLTTYYIIKPVREALILTGGGAELKSYLSTGQAFLLLGAVPLYAALANRVSRRKLLNTVTLFFAACLVLFFLLARLQVPLGVVFFLWVGIFSLMVVAQFWSFANDLYSEEAGRRLFPIIAIGASSGAALGSAIAAVLIAPLGVYHLLLVAAAILAASLLLTNWIERHAGRAGARPLGAEEKRASEEPMGRSGAFQLVLQNRYLLGIAFLMLLLNWVNTNGEYLLGRTVQAAAAQAVSAGTAGGLSEGEYIGKFYSQFFSAVNVAGLIAQMFLVSRIVKYLGVRWAILFLPAIAIGGYALLAFYPLLTVVRWTKTAENATDYSLNNTVRNILFLPTSREQKYKAKQAIDTFFHRTGDVLSSALVFVGTNVLLLHTRQFALVNLGLAIVWLVLAGFVGARYVRMTRDAVPAPGARQSAAGG